MKPILIICLLIGVQMNGQTIFTLDTCLVLMHQFSPVLAAAEDNAKADQARARGTLHLPAPQVSIESPTSQFFTPGISQSIEFPSVYVLQNKQGKTKAALSEVNKELTVAAMEKLVQEVYFEASYQTAIYQLYLERDSLGDQMIGAVKDYFDQGHLGAMQRDLMALHVTEQHLKLVIAQKNMKTALLHLSQLCGQKDMSVVPMKRMSQDTAMEGNESLFLKSKSLLLEEAKRDVQLAKNKALPGLMLGYMNQGARNSSVEMGFQFGVTLPIWWWSYKADIDAARYDHEAKTKMLDFEEMQRIESLQLAYAQLANLEMELEVYEAKSSVDVAKVINNALRMLKVGEISFMEYATILEQTYSGREQYLNLLKEWNGLLVLITYYQK